MRTVRILVTGSRDWPAPHAVEQALWNYINDDYIENGPAQYVVVHGDCPTGADAQADAWVRKVEDQDSIIVEKHPADWKRYGKRAGPKRNAEMVDMGADVCLAFIRNNSRGATMTADLAEHAKIDTRRMIL